MHNPIRWFEIYVNDMPRARKFYQDVFLYELTRLGDSNDPELWSFPSKDGQYGCGGALVKMEGFAAGSNSTIIYFASDDCETEQKRVEAAGGKVFKAKFSIGPYGYICLCLDTEGNMFGIHSM
jgi:predicted enzyme related to lactoylglutathione lyase